MAQDDDRMERILDAINDAYKKMLEYKIRNNELVLTTDVDGVFRALDPKVVYERVYGTFTK
ncbi:MAG: hypothetical protein HUJ97_00565 [Bacteroidales bacterium]|nr:hypothetical protein [Bacteroidales bacterium]